MKMEDLFNQILSNIELKLSPQSYNLWFSKLEPVSFNDNKITVLIPMGVYKQVLNNNYSDIINEACEQVYGKKLEFIYITKDEMNEVVDSFVLPEKKEEKKDYTWVTNLNPKFTFENYVVGDSNRLAYTAAHSVAEYPGKIHNPLFIYGRSGIGKTHLMHAIGNYIVQNTDLKVLYVTSGEFKEEYVNIFAEKDNEKISIAQKFKNKYQGVDVLIVDDIQFLVGSNQTQQEFFHTFNALYQKDKQIIISSDRSPDDLTKIEDRLKSRFNSGLPVDIYPPELQLRCKIIRSILRGTYLEERLDEDVIEYIANACTSDVRQIQGAINRLLADTSLWKPEKVDLKFASESLKTYVKVNVYAENTIEKIQKEVAKYYDIEVADLKSKKRNATVAKARQIAMYICRMQTDEVLERIGLEFGKDHSTVSAACDKIANEIKTDVKLNTVIKELINKL